MLTLEKSKKKEKLNSYEESEERKKSVPCPATGVNEIYDT